MEKALLDFTKGLPREFTREYGWMIQSVTAVFISLILTLVLCFVLSRLNRLKNRGQQRQTIAGVAFKSAITPVIFFIWTATLMFILKLVQKEFNIQIIKDILTIRPAIYGLLLCWFMMRLKNRFLARFSQKHPKISPSTIDLFSKLGSILIVVIIIIMLLPVFGFSITGLLAFGGVGGIIVGLAAQNTLANFFSSMQLHFERPFEIGDWINFPEKNLQGTVEHIGWRQVTMRNFDKRLVFIPTSFFNTAILENPSRMTHRRVNEVIGVRYDDLPKLEFIMNDIRAFLFAHKDADLEQPITVALTLFNSYSVDFQVVVFTRKTGAAEFAEFKQEILFGVSKIIHKHGADFAFPTQVQVDYKPSGEKI